MNIHRFLASILLGTVLWFGGYQPAFAVTVNCDVQAVADFDSITAALVVGNTFITFTGTCDEDINITRTNVELQGSDVATASVRHLTIDNAAVRLEGFTVTGGVDGLAIDLTQGSFANIENLKIDGIELSVFQNSAAQLRDSELIGPATGNALVIVRNSTVTVNGGNTITGNDPANHAVVVSSNSSLIMRAGGNQLVATSPILRVDGQSFAQLREGDITGDVLVDLHSVASVGAGRLGPADVTLNGDVTISRDSALVFEIPTEGTVTFNGEATCLDDESSASGSPSGNGDVDCTGFDAPFNPSGMGMGMGP